MNTELENRMIEFSSAAIGVAGSLKAGFAGSQLGHQLVRSATSATLNFGEAKGAQSRRDFIHKISLVIKELRETQMNLKIIKKVALSEDMKMIEHAIRESDELISIFNKTLITMKLNDEKKDC